MAQTPALAPFFALAAGIVASFLPCSLSTVPLIIGYVGGTGERDTKRSFLLSLTFAAGSAATFTTLGVAASFAGRMIGSGSSWWYLVLGVLMVLMAMQVWGIFTVIPSSYLVSMNKKRGFLGAFLAGVLGGVFSSPCSTPILVVLLAVVAGKGSALWGTLLLFLYSVGHGTLAVIAGTSVGFVQKLSRSGTYGKLSKIFTIVMGALILMIGFYMFYLGF
ncbi:MAG TPA: cytochrome c biogenesis protein CcdA [Oscillospiraceae bacterium]|nr:cytochrome c biogenesis protein CcdA [Oscillospiraceae bacterium]HQQ88805.1 cytochrome c biogenesis protein CcdA [Oscillospiraceae bacterium]HRW57881.1 cytochrome c biogenesis protein CcdA [Oscillospiraceae bacterium]